MKDGKWGCVDLENNVVVPLRYGERIYVDAKIADSDFAVVVTDGKEGVLDLVTGETIVPVEYEHECFTRALPMHSGRPSHRRKKAAADLRKSVATISRKCDRPPEMCRCRNWATISMKTCAGSRCSPTTRPGPRLSRHRPRWGTGGARCSLSDRRRGPILLCGCVKNSRFD